MRKYTQRDLRSFATQGMATNITNYSLVECQMLSANTDLRKEGYSTGTYGLSGLLMKDAKTGDFYVIFKRTTALAYFG